ncbi:MAG: site-specific DNA-methyltransferase [Prevotellaceae bacterium]|jgi:DNA modification methylase|nr:site-specific DNA-methyltransferase [Prevotellaceae bacterium]
MQLNPNFFLCNSGISNAVDTLNFPRHRWYYYKEGFSPTLVEKAIDSSGIKKTDIILDPFNGSGTTTLTSALNGFKSIGIEVNPFTSFLSQSKINNVKISEFHKKKDRILEKAYMGKESSLKGFSTFSKTADIDKWLFNDSVLDTFAGGWSASVKIENLDLRQVIQLALIVSAMQNCNATRDGKCLRYRDSWQNNIYSKDTFLSSLQSNLDLMIEDMEKFPIPEQPTILTGDARTILSNNNIEKFKLCITSPPYLNTFDYTDIYRPELFLGQFVKSREDLYNLRLRTIRSHIQAKWDNPDISNFGELYKNSISHIIQHKKELMHKRIPVMIQAYFEDMLNILKQLRSKAGKNAQLWMVVSNSAYADKEIQVDLIIAEMASLANWQLKEVGVLRNIKRRKTKHSPHINTLRESVIILNAGR